jgi:hypothetical protein
MHAHKAKAKRSEERERDRKKKVKVCCVRANRREGRKEGKEGGIISS